MADYMHDENGQSIMPFACDEEALAEFLTRCLAIENEQDRLREDLRELKQEYADRLPLRGVLTAVKIVRAREKLIYHPKESMPAQHLTNLEALVMAHILHEQEKDASTWQDA